MAELLQIVERIDEGIRDRETSHPDFDPLWDHPLLRESLLTMLKDGSGDHRDNFTIIAELLCPEFLETRTLERVMDAAVDSARV